MQPDFSTLKPAGGQPDFSSLKPVQSTSSKSLDGFANIQPGYFQRVGEQYQKAGQDITSAISTGAESLQKSDGSFQSLIQPTRTALRTVGAVAGAAFAPILEAPVIKPLTESLTKKAITIPEVKNIVTQATELAKKYPNAAGDLKNIIDIASLGGGSAAEKPLIQEGKAIGSDIAQATKVVLTPSEETIQKNVVNLFNKSIKPTAKKTLAQGEKYQNDILSALKTIKQEAPNLNIEDATGEIVSRTPQTIQELAQAVDQTKKLVFTQYDNLAKQAGTSGAIIDAKPIADEVLKVAQSKALQLTNPEIVKYAEDWSTRLKGFGVLDTETTQEVIKLMNNNLQSFYKNPTYDAASKVAVDAGIANNFRQALDKAIEGATGEQYQILKNQYGALKAIENDVLKASMRDAKKNVKGLLDYTDIFTGGQMVAGILSLNPAMFTKGAIERGFKEYLKFLNDPNRAINNIFEKLNVKTGETFNPTSATGQFIKNPKLGASIQRVGQNEDKIAKQLLSLDTSVPTVNGAPALDSMTTNWQRLDELKNKLETKGLTKPEYAEVDTLLRTTPGAGELKNATSPLIQEAKKYKSAEEFANKAPSKIIDELRNNGVRGAEQRMVFWEQATKGMDKTPVIDSMNPTGGLLVDYTPAERMKAQLAPNITTLDKTMGKSADEMITIYRGAPKNQKAINPGDFVTTNPELARSYTGDGNVLSKKVKLSDVLDDMDEPLGEEYLYRPKSQLTDIWNKANKK